WTTLLGEPFPTRGADADGQMRLASLRLSQEWLDRSDRSVLALRSEFGLGVDAFNPTVPYDALYNLTAPNPNYWLWRGQGQWLQKIGDDALFVVRTDLQITNSSLPSLEQFTLGGLGSVVGYRQNILLTDSGLFAALEVRLPIYRIPEEKAVLQLVPFVNFGTGWNSKIPNPEINTLASVGVGLLWQYGNQVSARLDWGQRLGKIPYLEGNSLQDDGFVFSVTITP
ncbi:MAG: BamA/TamA family outer membrane protein, partial [Snowella sp.]|nr:BamA/TamA family outer membrane protein [Snowella sp.]